MLFTTATAEAGMTDLHEHVVGSGKQVGNSMGLQRIIVGTHPQRSRS